MGTHEALKLYLDRMISMTSFKGLFCSRYSSPIVSLWANHWSLVGYDFRRLGVLCRLLNV